ncbi:MAG: acyltransferase family protein [Clostridium neonatale]
MNNVQKISLYNNTLKKERIEWIDIYKGILMICVLFGHIWSGKITTFMYVFHMSAFFFISGYLEKIENKTLFEMIQIRFRSLIIPYIGVNLLYSIMRVFFFGIGLNDILFKAPYKFDSIFDFCKTVVRYPQTNDIFVGSWFLLVLFFTSIITKIFYIVNKSKVNLIFLLEGFIGGAIAYWLIHNEVNFIIPIDLALVASFYYILGIYISRRDILSKLKIKYSLLLIFISILYFKLYTIGIFKNVDYNSRLFNNYFMDIIGALIGIVLIYNIAQFIENTLYKNIVKYIGENSMGLMLLQFAIFRFIIMIESSIGIRDKIYLKENSPVTQSCYDVFFYVATTLIIFYFFNKRFEYKKIYSILFLGKYKKKIKKHKIQRILTYVSIILILIVSIPYKSIYNIRNYGKSIEYCTDLKGRYEDKWVGKELTGTFKSTNKGEINIILYSIEECNGNYMKVYNGENIIGESEISSGKNNFSYKVPKNQEIKLKLEFSKSFIPSTINKESSDERVLSVIVENIRTN